MIRHIIVTLLTWLIVSPTVVILGWINPNCPYTDWQLFLKSQAIFAVIWLTVSTVILLVKD